MMSITLNFRINRALRQIRNVFRDRTRWVQRSYHILPHPDLGTVEQFCVRGALMQATGVRSSDHSDLFLPDPDLMYVDARAVLNSAAQRLYGMNSMSVNDSKGYDATMHMLDEAIKETSQ